jgi:hypothetical protein
MHGATLMKKKKKKKTKNKGTWRPIWCSSSCKNIKPQLQQENKNKSDGRREVLLTISKNGASDICACLILLASFRIINLVLNIRAVKFALGRKTIQTSTVLFDR